MEPPSNQFNPNVVSDHAESKLYMRITSFFRNKAAGSGSEFGGRKICPVPKTWWLWQFFWSVRASLEPLAAAKAQLVLARWGSEVYQICRETLKFGPTRACVTVSNISVKTNFRTSSNEVTLVRWPIQTTKVLLLLDEWERKCHMAVSTFRDLINRYLAWSER